MFEGEKEMNQTPPRVPASATTTVNGIQGTFQQNLDRIGSNNAITTALKWQRDIGVDLEKYGSF